MNDNTREWLVTFFLAFAPMAYVMLVESILG